MGANGLTEAEVLKVERRNFFVAILASFIGYTIITYLLNLIRATASLWLVWPLIFIQIILYISIFALSYRRLVLTGINNKIALLCAGCLLILGRINDWEHIVLPVTLVVMLIISQRIRRVYASKWGKY